MLEEDRGREPVSQTIQISDKSAALLAQQAAARGVTLEAWIEKLASEMAQDENSSFDDRSGSNIQHRSKSLVEQMRELRSQIKPDPEGWTVRDYIDYGRR